MWIITFLIPDSLILGVSTELYSNGTEKFDKSHYKTNKPLQVQVPIYIIMIWFDGTNSLTIYSSEIQWYLYKDLS